MSLESIACVRDINIGYNTKKFYKTFRKMVKTAEYTLVTNLFSKMDQFIYKQLATSKLDTLIIYVVTLMYSKFHTSEQQRSKHDPETMTCQAHIWHSCILTNETGFNKETNIFIDLRKQQDLNIQPATSLHCNGLNGIK